ncbi:MULTISPECIES: hypothetical protein [unclassified Deinococcus]|uniref:hypothetical protein n=2 Tax=Deinococcus TaxID=1298 RepID=UPI000C1826C0|nr:MULTISPECIES: hypothetical protein [unclassified Deinococcus]MCD0158709.1 hypothetical protein [Deinococcus sp. 6GRE01]MCD0176724.1 hypothetical protein [Deinococcus sp. 14RED07]PIG97863.1 hypothetical protein AMD26_011685 [Deinococcus sp. UR1]
MTRFTDGRSPDGSRAARPAAMHLTMLSRGRVYGLFRSLEDVQGCTARLLDLGLAGQSVQLLMGEDGAAALDCDGRRHGLWARLLRLMQGMTDERAHVERYAEALGWGEILLSVDVAGQPGQVPQVAQAFRESGAHFVNHYGAWVVEPLSA